MRTFFAVTLVLLLVPASVAARTPVEAEGCGELDVRSIEDILALEAPELAIVQGVKVECADETRVEVFTGDQSLIRRLAPDQMPPTGVERFIALNAAEMVELFSPVEQSEPSAPEPEVQESPAAALVADSVTLEKPGKPLQIHVAGLMRFDLGAPAPAGGFAVEAEVPLVSSLAIGLDFQTATSSTQIARSAADQLFLAGAVKGVWTIDGARVAALFRAGGVEVVRDASQTSGWAFWGGPALSAGYRLEIADPLWLDASTEVGFSPWTWGASFDGEGEFRTENLWFSAQLGLTLAI